MIGVDTKGLIILRREADKALPKNYDITEIYPYFFWKTCQKCGDKIKRETMWKVYIWSGRWGNVDLTSSLNICKIYCKKCYNEKELIELCEEKT